MCICVFFFFKQKTAYEMRISDWSSDVCSSDLQKAAGEIEAAYRIAVALVSGKISRPDSIGGGKHSMTDAEADQVRVYVFWIRELERRKIPQIGRASCRERVCQYV